MTLTTLGTSNKEAALSAARAFTALLYDPRGTEKNAHSNLNRLRLKLVNKKDRSLAKLPSCETSFEELARRAQWQTKVWMSSNLTKPNIGSHWSMDGKEKVENLYPSTAKVQWRQSSWKVSSAHAQLKVAAQTTAHAVSTVCVAQSCAHVMAMKTVKIHIQLAT